MRERFVFWAQAALVAPVLGFAFSPVLRSLVSAWVNRNDYSHGFVVPLISAYFIWESRVGLRSLAVKPALLAGSLLLALSCSLLVAGAAASIQALQQVSVLFAVPAVVLLLLGWRFLRALALPIAYLVFMIPPVFDVLIAPLHWPLQLYSAAGAALFLGILGVPVYHSAQYLELSGKTLEVAQACSGIRFLVSIVALGVPLAFLTQRSARRRAALIAAAILIGVGLNPVRITLIALWALRGDGVLHGPFHILQGMFVSVVGFSLLFLLAWFFSDAGPREPERQGAANAVPEVPGRRFRLALLVAVVMLGGTGAVIHAGEPRPVHLATPLEELPAVLGDWTAVAMPAGPGFFLEGADQSLDRVYRDQRGSRVRLQIGYYASQRQGKEMVSYRLDELYGKARVVEIGKDQGRFPVSLTELRSPRSRRVVLFWHHAGGRDIAGHLAAKAATAGRWLFERRTNGAVVIVSAELTAGDDASGAIGTLADFAALVRDAAALD